MLDRARWIVGTKDYINFRLTGRIATDHSYASGFGFYSLIEHRYADAHPAAGCRGRGGADRRNGYEALMQLAAAAPRGANGLVFVPTLGGGTLFEGGPGVRGAFVGLDLKHTRADVIRATLEGVALGLRVALHELRRMTQVQDAMIMVGGGARSPIWRRIFPDVFGCAVAKASIDQQATALGAAALALVGVGLWRDFSPIGAIQAAEPPIRPDAAAKPIYDAALAVYRKAAEGQRDTADLLVALRSLSQ